MKKQIQDQIVETDYKEIERSLIYVNKLSFRCL